MNQDTQKIIQQMADKLGVTVQYLWAVLIRGNRVEGAILMGFVLLGFGLMYGGYRSFRAAFAADGYDADKFYVGGWAATIAGAALIISCMYWAVMGLFCPEYGALADILSHIR